MFSYTAPYGEEPPSSCDPLDVQCDIPLKTTMKKARSLDLGRIRALYSSMKNSEATQVASQFSRRAARGSYTQKGQCQTLKESDSLSSRPEETGLPNAATASSWTSRRPLLDASTGDDSLPETTTTYMMRIPTTWTVGKLSVFILLLATAVDFCVCQVHRLESPVMYDALSAEVIRPAFRYQTTNPNPRAQRSSLGSAAISSVTEALSPILPFAGGLDLRREDYWSTSGNWIERLQSVATQVQDAFRQQNSNVDDDTASEAATLRVPRGGGNVPGKFSSKQRNKRTHVSAISAQQPFVSVDAIAELTLGDVAETFRYAVECNKEDFHEGRFMNGLRPRVKKVVAAMQDAVTKSRGKDVKVSRSGGVGGVDALAFSAAMRLFAEWRVLRQVPEGYKGFAVGMSLGHKDVVQNVAKIESSIHSWVDRRRDMLALQAQWEENGSDENCPLDGSTPRELRSPSLRELLEHEIEMDINPTHKLPRLREKSAAMGLLWTRRQLHYQTLLLDNFVKIPRKFASTADAVKAAYKAVYDRYHGWAVQKIFNYSFQSAPEAEEIYQHMNPHRLKEVLNSAQRIKPNKNDLPSMSSSDDETNDNPIDAFVKHIGGEWDKFVSSIGQVFGNGRNAAELDVRGGGRTLAVERNNEMDNYIAQEMVKDAHEQIATYLKVVYPVLDDLKELFDELNMDDPTKV